jgi:hypothetical protein
MTRDDGSDRDNFDLNHFYRNGGNLVEDRDNGRDCVTQMRLLRSRPDVLANVLREMGVTESGDGLPDDE